MLQLRDQFEFNTQFYIFDLFKIKNKKFNSRGNKMYT